MKEHRKINAFHITYTLYSQSFVNYTKLQPQKDFPYMYKPPNSKSNIGVYEYISMMI